MDLRLLGDIILGEFTIIDLIAATTNAFDGALLARQPSPSSKSRSTFATISSSRRGTAEGIETDANDR